MVAIGLIVLVLFLLWGSWVLHYAITQYPIDERLRTYTRQ